MKQTKNNKMQLTIGIVIILLLVGLFSGVLSGLFGVGGGIIIVPCLIFFLAFTQKQAQGTSLGVIALPVAFIGMWQYYKQGYVDYKVVIIVAIGFVIGGLLGGKLAVKVSDNILKKGFGLLLLLIAIKMLFFDNKEAKPSNEEQVSIKNTNKN